MRKVKEIVALDPKSTPVSEYDKVFSFLNIKNLPEDELNRKEMYLTSYRFHVFWRSSILVSFISLVSSTFFLIWSKFASIGSVDRAYMILSEFWLMSYFSGGQIFVASSRAWSNKSDLEVYSGTCGLVSMIWLSWLLWRIFRDSIDRGNYAPNDRESGIDNVRFRFGLLNAGVFALSMVFLTLSLLNFPGRPSIFVLSSNDSINIYIYKTVIFVSLGFWFLGLSSILLSIAIKGTSSGRVVP